MHFLLTIKVSYFLFFTYVKSSRFTMTWKENLPHINKFFSFSYFQLLQLLECLSGYMCGDNLTMKFPLDFHKYTALNGLVNSFPKFTIAPPNKLTVVCKPHWFAKRKKNNIMWEVVPRCPAKQLSYKFLKIHREIPVQQSLSNIVKSFHPVRFKTF